MTTNSFLRQYMLDSTIDHVNLFYVEEHCATIMTHIVPDRVNMAVSHNSELYHSEG